MSDKKRDKDLDSKNNNNINLNLKEKNKENKANPLQNSNIDIQRNIILLTL